MYKIYNHILQVFQTSFFSVNLSPCQRGSGNVKEACLGVFL